VLAAYLASLALGSIAIHVESAEGVDATEVESIVALMKRAIEAQASDIVSVDPRAGEACDVDRPACINSIANRMATSDVLLLRFIGVVTKIGVSAEHVRPAPAEPLEAQASLGSDPDKRWTTITKLVAALFPKQKPLPLATCPADAKAPARAAADSGPSRPIGAYIGLAAGLAAVGIAAGIWTSQRSSEDDLRVKLALRDPTTNLIDGVSYDDAQRSLSSINTRRTISAVTGIAGAAIAIGSVVWLVLASGLGEAQRRD
jgi:hypothetical protein